LSEHSKSSKNSEHNRRASLADLAAAVGIALLGVFIGAGSFSIPLGVGYDRIGPRFFPSLVAAGLVLLGLWLAVTGLRTTPKSPRRRQCPRQAGRGTEAAETEFPDADIPTNWRALGYLAAGLLLCLALFERGGFVIASSTLFWVAAQGFGSRRPLRDVVVAVALAVAVFLAFTRELGLMLPLGVLGRFF
jgi:putative tricarboxylic transport membrane protein